MPLPRGRILSLAVCVTITFGVAALTTAFGIVNAALLRQPPFADPRRLTLLYLVRDEQGLPRRERWSFGRIQLLQQSQRSFGSGSV
ncbi:MAG TPA: hypothetical protein VGQ73_00075 [Gemmatimonadales bacterium]|jgi:hypothetical protein|nr:hypothetical protein [Gemmatimonadales bacterium]